MDKNFLKKPEWLKIKILYNEKYNEVKEVVSSYKLHTVCQEAHCPNISECWSSGTATFMIMGDVCTRACKFCSVKTGNPMKRLDSEEPMRLVEGIKRLKIFDYVVLTSVDRDDLEDYGARHFALCISEIKNKIPNIIVEALIPDFRGREDCINKIAEPNPDVIAHNIETVERLQKKVRDVRANYLQSLNVLQKVKKINGNIYTKSAIMLGLGEKDEEVIESMKDLKDSGVDILTIGQYLRPSEQHLEVVSYIKPEKFDFFKNKASEMGFLYCASGPFVRSSYKAGELFLKGMIRK